MAERTSVTQVVQFGVESTKGTAVAANRAMRSLQLETSIDGTFTEVLPGGYKFPVAHAPGKEWVSASFKADTISYDEIHMLLSSLLSYTAPTQQGGTTAYSWPHTPDTDAEDTVKTFTVEQGSSVRAHKFAHGQVTDMTIKGDRDKVEVSGSMIGTRLSDGITLTASPTVLNIQPILAKEVAVYMDPASGDIGTTKLTRVLSWELAVKNRFSPLWVVDSAETSWVAAVETPVQAELKLKVQADSTAMALLTSMRAGTKQFVRVKATSATEAGTAYPYSATFDVCGVVNAPPGKFEDADGVYAIEWTFGAVHDETWAKALTATIINARSAL